MYEVVCKGHLSDGRQYGLRFVEELLTETGLLLLIPARRIDEIPLRLRPKADLHCHILLRVSASTSDASRPAFLSSS